MKYAQRAKEIMAIEIAEMRRARAALGREFGQAVRRLLRQLKAGGKIVITGVGKNMPIGQKMAATFTSTGAPAVWLHPLEALHGDLGLLQKNDVLLALSFSGETEELISLLLYAKRLGVPIVALTGRRDSSLAQQSDTVIPVAVAREACPFNMAPTASTTATLAVGDALAMVLLEARGFRKEDFARLHPGGAIGRTLLLKAADIMRRGDRVAWVPRAATVKDAVLAMTRARAGSVAVLAAGRRVAGIFTDGDLRRHVTSDKHIATTPVVEYMTPDPITVQADELAEDVLAIYEQHNIDDLIVVDRRGRLAGMIDIQDLPKLKIL